MNTGAASPRNGDRTAAEARIRARHHCRRRHGKDFFPWRRALEAQRATLAVQRRANALAAGYLKAVSEGVGREGHASAANVSALGKATEALTRSAQDVVTQAEQLGKRDAELQAQPDALRRAHGNVSAGTFYTARIAVAAPRGGTLRLS